MRSQVIVEFGIRSGADAAARRGEPPVERSAAGTDRQPGGVDAVISGSTERQNRRRQRGEFAAPAPPRECSAG